MAAGARNKRVANELRRLQREPLPHIALWLREEEEEEGQGIERTGEPAGGAVAWGGRGAGNGVLSGSGGGSDMGRLGASMRGPEGSVFHEGRFELTLDIPDSYPFDPPRARFRTKIYHPNIDEGGRICLDLLKKAGANTPKAQMMAHWTPKQTLRSVLLSIQQLLAEPNPDDPLVPDIAAQFVHRRAEYERFVREHVQKFAASAVGAEGGAAGAVPTEDAIAPQLSSRIPAGGRSPPAAAQRRTSSLPSPEIPSTVAKRRDRSPSEISSVAGLRPGFQSEELLHGEKTCFPVSASPLLPIAGASEKVCVDDPPSLSCSEEGSGSSLHADDAVLRDSLLSGGSDSSSLMSVEPEPEGHGELAEGRFEQTTLRPKRYLNPPLGEMDEFRPLSVQVTSSDDDGLEFSLSVARKGHENQSGGGFIPIANTPSQKERRHNKVSSSSPAPVAAFSAVGGAPPIDSAIAEDDDVPLICQIGDGQANPVVLDDDDDDPPVPRSKKRKDKPSSTAKGSLQKKAKRESTKTTKRKHRPKGQDVVFLSDLDLEELSDDFVQELPRPSKRKHRRSSKKHNKSRSRN